MASSESVDYDQPAITFFERGAGPPISFREHRYDDKSSEIELRLRQGSVRLSQPLSLRHHRFGLIAPLIEHELALAARRQIFFYWAQRNPDVRYYSIPLIEAFNMARQEYPGISVDSQVMGGAPCVAGTRIPVYMILDAIEYHGSVEGALKSYPRLTIDQVRDAIGFAKVVVECPIGEETTTST